MPPKRLVQLVAGVVCLVAALALVARAGLPERADFTGVIDTSGTRFAPEIGAQAPVFRTVAADGSTVSLDALAGRPVILNFWATWCGPCRVEMPELEALQTAAGDTIAVVGVNTGEALEDVLDWRDNYGLTFPLALDPAGNISTLYAIRGQPTTFLIAPNGEIVHIYYGPVSRATLEDALRPYTETALAPLHPTESTA
jgi:thiol-disulfide isomerase/thioredoxin